ncbi:hypothetical protein Tco_1426963, partial [Tanacetum coccineum]
MFKEDQPVDVAALPKFNMTSYESCMSAKDVKSLAIRHDIPLDLHPITLTKGWNMDKLSDDMIGLYEQYFEFSGIRVIDLQPVPSGLLFQGGSATTWDFPGFCHVFKDTEGNVVTMSKYLRFPFLSGASISKSAALTAQDRIDPKIVAIRERKARAAAKKREKKKRGEDEGEGSRPKVKRRKTIAARKGGSATSEHVSSPEPIRVVDPTSPVGGNPFAAAAETAKSREDRSLYISPHDSANHSVHNYTDAHGDKETNSLRLGSFVGQSKGALTNVNTEVLQSSQANQSAHNSPMAERMISLRSPLQGTNAEEGESSHCVLSMCLSGLFTGDAAVWFSLAHGALDQTNILKRFEYLQADYDKLAETHSECEETTGKLIQAKVDLEHNAKLYNDMVERYKKARDEHSGCAEKLRVVKDQNNKLSRVNKDQALRIKELEDELPRKDSTLVYAERNSAERAQEKEKLVTELGHIKMENFDCIRKLLPTVVDRLFQSHEYKKSFSEPFNLAIQAGRAKGPAEGRSEGDIMDALSKVENSDPYSDKKMYIEYDKL